MSSQYVPISIDDLKRVIANTRRYPDNEAQACLLKFDFSSREELFDMARYFKSFRPEKYYRDLRDVIVLTC